ncbi:MAG: hypothetical protein AAF360_00990 [Pseudomonadota bacterium]
MSGLKSFRLRAFFISVLVIGGVGVPHLATQSAAEGLRFSGSITGYSGISRHNSAVGQRRATSFRDIRRSQDRRALRDPRARRGAGIGRIGRAHRRARRR